MNNSENQPPKVALKPIERLTAAATLMGEARGQLYLGKVAVAWVIRNRLEPKKWWAKWTPLDSRITGISAPSYSVVAVCRKLYQFSCWNKNDPSYALCQKFADPAQFENNLLNPQFSDCLKAVDEVFGGKVGDITKGATHYFNPRVCDPKWDDDGILTTVVGAHRFYKGIK